MKPMRLQVKIPTIGVFSIKGRSGVGEVEQLVETMVDSLRRRIFKGVLADAFVMARAFVPEQFRRHLRETGRLIDGEYAWCVATVADNKKSLAPFIASGELERNPKVDSIGGIKVNISKSNITKHRSVLDEKVMLRVLSEAVAKAAGINLDADGVTVHTFVTTRDSSTSPHNEAVVEITVDHDAQPLAAEAQS